MVFEFIRFVVDLPFTVVLILRTMYFTTKNNQNLIAYIIIMEISYWYPHLYTYQ